MIKVLIKGAGDLATGVAIVLRNSGFKVLMTEIEQPTVIRRSVSFATAIYEKEVSVEGIQAQLVNELNYEKIIEDGKVGVIVDPYGTILKSYQPDIVVDAILAKKNLGTTMADGPIVIALGPGFEASKDCHLVVETKRGHYLGELIRQGSTIPNTGIPGEIGGRKEERVIKAPVDGTLTWIRKLGDMARENEPVLKVDDCVVKAAFTGCLRGLLMEGLPVHKGMKIGDIDPRGDASYCTTISDKSRALGRAVLEGALELGKEKGYFEVTRKCIKL